jgi:peptidoglycan hydrolase-like protein with peptidoglycan-binding domain
MSRFIAVAMGAVGVTLALVPGVALGSGGSRSSVPPLRVHAHQQAERRADAHPPVHRSDTHQNTYRRHHLEAALVPGTGYSSAVGSAQVETLQKRLAVLGFSPGPVDGRYGPLTMRAVERFQAAAGLSVDGISGRRTLMLLSASERAVLAPGAGYHQPGGSERVRALQRQLHRLGLRPGPVDGRYGPLTTRAVRRLQRTYWLPADGVVDVVTGELARVAARPVRVGHPPAPSPAAVPPRTPATPPVSSRPRGGQAPRPTPALPVLPIVLAMGVLGLTATLSSYWRTRRRIRHGRGAPAPPATSEPHTTSPNGGTTIKRGGAA